MSAKESRICNQFIEEVPNARKLAALFMGHSYSEALMVRQLNLPEDHIGVVNAGWMRWNNEERMIAMRFFGYPKDNLEVVRLEIANLNPIAEFHMPDGWKWDTSTKGFIIALQAGKYTLDGQLITNANRDQFSHTPWVFDIVTYAADDAAQWDKSGYRHTVCSAFVSKIAMMEAEEKAVYQQDGGNFTSLSAFAKRRKPND
jgi:hypothetical protein